MAPKSTKIVAPGRDYGLLGAHFSIAGGLQRALFEAQAHECTAVQIFTKNANSWAERVLTTAEIERFEAAKADTGILTIASHTSYLINPAAADARKFEQSCDALRQELIRSSQLGIPLVVLHPGSHMGAGEQQGLEQIGAAVGRILKETDGLRTRLLFETTAGQGSSLGHTFAQLAILLERTGSPRHTGICLDTSHVFAAGYDIRTAETLERTLAEFDREIGLEHLRLIHLNDSKKEFGSRVDRHEHIGRGCIGDAAFEHIMNHRRLRAIPKIIETPKGEKGENWDRINLERLKAFVC
jgi:deoxyribonuclease-4